MNYQLIIKVLLTSLIVVAISEATKRWTFLGALIASLPLTSILAMVWLYFDTKDLNQVSQLSYSIFWIVIPSLVFFLCFPTLTKMGWHFWSALGMSAGTTVACYFVYLWMLKHFGIEI